MSRIEVGGGGPGGGGGSGTSGTSAIKGPFRVVLAELASTPATSTVIVPLDDGDIIRAMWAREVVPYATEDSSPFLSIDTPSYEGKFSATGLQLNTLGAGVIPAQFAAMNGVSDGTDAAIFTGTVYTAGEYDVYVEVISGSAYLT